MIRVIENLIASESWKSTIFQECFTYLRGKKIVWTKMAKQGTSEYFHPLSAISFIVGRNVPSSMCRDIEATQKAYAPIWKSDHEKVDTTTVNLNTCWLAFIPTCQIEQEVRNVYEAHRKQFTCHSRPKILELRYVKCQNKHRKKWKRWEHHCTFRILAHLQLSQRN